MKTKTVGALFLVAATGFLITGLLISRSARARFASEKATWQAEKTALEAALEQARSAQPAPLPVPSVRTVSITNRPSAEEILTRLQSMRVANNSPRDARRIIHEFENLIDLGPAALPVIGQFLARNVDIEYDAAGRKGFRDGRIPLEFTVPPSLRFGLLEVARTVRGDAGEQVLADVLKSTGRGAELAYATYALQEIAPNKYRETALAAAKELLGRPLPAASSSPLDKSDRDCLYAVLTFFNDTTYVTSAQSQMVQPDGKLDPVAVRYLQQILGEQFVPLAIQTWQDSRIAADQKEPLARVALAYTGLNSQAEQLYQAAINDPNLSPDARRNLIEDLNETGFADPKHLTAADLPLIQKRLGIIEQLAPHSMDQVNAKAFREAYKDLVNMQNSLLPKTTPSK